MSHPSDTYNLALSLSRLTDDASRTVANNIAEQIRRMIDEAVETHREDSPHIYADGSTY